ncbi:hypothetical protein LguiB_012399 [Lonicera macranthoides]
MLTTTPRRLLWRQWLPVAALILLLVYSTKPAASQPQTNLLNTGCNLYNAGDLPSFFDNLNGTLSDLRRQLSSGNTKFATASQARNTNPVYGLAQCRDYLSTADCLACFDASVRQSRNCSANTGARVIYDGCFLRYEGDTFYDETANPGSMGLCGNQAASQATAFATTVQGLLTDLVVATPRINGYFAATTRAAVGADLTVYAVAQCAQTVSSSGCLNCLSVARNNIQSCPPDADARAVDAGCFLRYSNTSFFPANQTTNITPFLGGGRSSNKKKAIIGGLGGGGGFLLLILAFFLWYTLSKKPNDAIRGNTLGATELRGAHNYSYRDLKSATKNFSQEYKLGEGGFGEVFKGILKNGNVVAVKRITMSSSRANKEFESEVRLISNVHHRNLIRLLGCCSKSSKLFLVLEYMANGSLDKLLFGEKKGTLNWKQRFNIIFGTARGLAYLHEQFHVTIIHRDIKSSNILLDNSFQPKIADFGLARLMPGDQSHVSSKFAGTLGYTAPEYAIHGRLSEKVDTYSFGVVVLEIISGRRCTEIQDDPLSDYLLENAWKLYENDMHLKLVDETLDPNEYTPEEAKKIIEIALMCTQSPVSLRPNMSDVVASLSSDRFLDGKPTNHSSLVDSEHKVLGNTMSTSSTSTNTNAAASFSESTGR